MSPDQSVPISSTRKGWSRPRFSGLCPQLHYGLGKSSILLLDKEGPNFLSSSWASFCDPSAKCCSSPWVEEQPDCGGREPNLQEDGWSVFPRACESELGESHKYGRGSAEWRLELKFNSRSLCWGRQSQDKGCAHFQWQQFIGTLCAGLCTTHFTNTVELTSPSQVGDFIMPP